MRRFCTLAVLLVLAALPTRSEAQFTLGGALGLHEHHDLGIGVFAVKPMPTLHESIFIAGDFGLFFPDGGNNVVDVSYWELNGNVLFAFPVSNESIQPWAMGGLLIAHFSVSEDVTDLNLGASATDIGLNLGGGITINPSARMSPVVGAKLELQDGSSFVVFGGLGFAVGG